MSELTQKAPSLSGMGCYTLLPAPDISIPSGLFLDNDSPWNIVRYRFPRDMLAGNNSLVIYGQGQFLRGILQGIDSLLLYHGILNVYVRVTDLYIT